MAKKQSDKDKAKENEIVEVNETSNVDDEESAADKAIKATNAFARVLAEGAAQATGAVKAAVDAAPDIAQGAFDSATDAEYVGSVYLTFDIDFFIADLYLNRFELAVPAKALFERRGHYRVRAELLGHGAGRLGAYLADSAEPVFFSARGYEESASVLARNLVEFFVDEALQAFLVIRCDSLKQGSVSYEAPRHRHEAFVVGVSYGA